MPITLRRPLCVCGLLIIASLSLNAAKPDKTPVGPLEVESAPVKAGQPGNARAIHYQLPKNYFQFAFKLKTTTNKQGAYCDVAGYFFELPRKFDCKHPDPAFEVNLGDQIAVSQLSQPDPDAAFDLNIKSGTFTETNLTLGFGESNILTGAQSAIADHKVDFFVSILKTAASVASHIIPLALQAAPPSPIAGTPKKTKTEEPSASCANQLDEGERPLLNRLGPAHKAFACRLSDDLRSAYLAIPDPYKAYVDAYRRDGHDFDGHFANALALFVEYSALNADEARFLHPERLPVNSDAFASIVKARDVKKKSIREQFFGSKEDRIDEVPLITWQFGNPDQEVELFSFDSATEEGICFRRAVDERWAARPIGVDACNASSSTLVGVYAVLRRMTPPAAKDTGADANANYDQTGVAYRIPGRAALRVFARKEDKSEYDYLSAAFDIAQFGTVKFLPAKLGSSSSYNVALDPMTGALKNVTIGVKPLLSGEMAKQIDDLSGQILGVVDAVHAARKKPSALEVAQGEEQLKLEQLKIQMIESCKADPSQSFCTTLFK